MIMVHDTSEAFFVTVEPEAFVAMRCQAGGYLYYVHCKASREALNNAVHSQYISCTVAGGSDELVGRRHGGTPNVSDEPRPSAPPVSLASLFPQPSDLLVVPRLRYPL